jgi:hypothetical protein
MPSRDADAQQLRRLATVADRRRPVDERKGGQNGDQREDTDNDVVGSGFHHRIP